MPGMLTVLKGVAVAAASLASGFAALFLLDLQGHLRPAPDGMHSRVAVVFTGDQDRITLGLDLLARDRIDQLFVSGVDRRGLQDLARSAASLPPGKIVRHGDAGDTLENALETGCWLRAAAPAASSVLLITSRSHLPRAALALERALPGGVRVERLHPPGVTDWPPLSVEFVKFAATWVLTLAPPRYWSDRSLDVCRPGDGAAAVGRG